MAVQPLPPQALRWTLDPSDLTSADATQGSHQLVGQPRAEDAMAFAISLRQHGYHIYLSGPTGTGRTTFARRRLALAAPSLPKAEDWLYLPDFGNPQSPRAVAVPAGTGPRFAQALRQLRRDLSESLPQAFASDEYNRARDAALEEISQRTDEEYREFQRAARELGFLVQPGPTGLSSVPLQGQRPLSQQDVSHLPHEEREVIEKGAQQVHKLSEGFARRTHELQLEAQRKLSELTRQRAIFTCTPLFERLADLFPEAELQAHVSDLLQHVEEWLPLFLPGEESEPPEDPGWFEVNAFVVRASSEPPVVYEPNPSYYNLMGSIEFQGVPGGSTRTSFKLIRAGAIHRANGGYLVLPARELLENPFAYEGLKRALVHRQARVENMGQQDRSVPTVGLSPEPIPLDVQVVLVGPEAAYHHLRQLEEQFRKLFKVRVDFAADMENDAGNRGALVSFLEGLQASHDIRPFTKGGAARVIEEAARLAGGRRRLSTRMSAIIELAVESDAFAAMAGATRIDERHVTQSLAARKQRAGLLEERMLDQISSGVIRIETRGRRVGQINGLTVLSAGERAFGLPARITARTYAGGAGVVDIEREIMLSGPIHSKGVLTLSGFLGGRFGRRQPLSLSASLTIEQNYGGIDGDSASSTELYAILSDLADLPLRQDIAVTGSVDQEGQIQPIGGVNEKIEGFYAVCKAHGLTGTQGCMIPRQNVDDLMLSEEVVQAARDGTFHVYAIETIEQGIELLSGLPAGEEGPAGYPAGTVFGRVVSRLAMYADAVAQAQPGQRASPA